MTSTNTQADAIVTNLRSTVLGFVTNDALSDADKVTIANAYQAVHVSRRGAVQGSIMAEALATDKVNHATLGAILEVFTNVSDIATGTRKEAPVNVTLNTALVLSAVHVANMILAENVTNDAAILAAGFVTEGLPTEYTDNVLTVAQRIVDAFTAKAPKARTSYTDTLATLIERGDIAANDVLTGDDDAECIVTGDGKVIPCGKGSTDPVSLSVAAQAFTGHSTNGWAFWQYNGSPIGDLRQA